MERDTAPLLSRPRKLRQFREVFPSPPQHGPATFTSWLQRSVVGSFAEALSSLGSLRLLEWLVRRDENGKWVVTYTLEKLLRDAIAVRFALPPLFPASARPFSS